MNCSSWPVPVRHMVALCRDARSEKENVATCAAAGAGRCAVPVVRCALWLWLSPMWPVVWPCARARPHQTPRAQSQSPERERPELSQAVGQIERWGGTSGGRPPTHTRMCVCGRPPSSHPPPTTHVAHISRMGDCDWWNADSRQMDMVHGVKELYTVRGERPARYHPDPRHLSHRRRCDRRSRRR